jgi:hydroxyacylglutathione hydrolase
MSAGALAEVDARACAIIDTRTWREFKQGHLAGSLYVPLNASFPTDAGSFVREGEGVYLIVEAGRVEEGVRDLVRVGIDDVRGWLSPGALREFAAGGGKLATARDIDAREAASYLSEAKPVVIDVRRGSEHAMGTLPGAVNIAHTRLAAHVGELPKDRPILVHCQGGGRSARAVALLRREGFDAFNLAGGYAGWMAVNG